jgi:molybdopterin biosynthesis enzyme
MRLTDLITSWSEVRSWLSLLSGAPLSALVFLAIYLRPIALKWIEYRAKSSDIRTQCDCQVEIERIRSTPQAPASVVEKPKQRGARKRKVLPPHR